MSWLVVKYCCSGLEATPLFIINISLLICSLNISHNFGIFNFLYSVLVCLTIKSLPTMVIDLWTFVCPIGYNGKIQLWLIKYRNEDAVTLFLVCLVVLTYGVHR